MLISERIAESPTLVFAEAAQKRRKEGKDIISMGIGEPDIKTPDFLIESVLEVAKDTSKNGYLNAMGLPVLREKISEDLIGRKQFNFSADRIMITAGAKQAIQLILFSLLEPNDEVIFFTPCYVSYIPQILLAEPKAVPVDIPLSINFDIDLNLLEQKITPKTKVIMLNAPHNPTGKIFDKSTLLKIAEIALKNNIYIILDDVYELLIYDGEENFSIGTIAEMEKLLFFVNSFSKSHAVPGWRIGYLCGPKQIMPTLLKIQQHMHTNTCSLIQHASVAIFNNGFDFLKPYREVLKNRADFIYNELSNVIETPIFKPQGGFFYFFDISAFSNNSNEFCAGLIDQVGVALTPGIAFGDSWDKYVRLSFGVNDAELKDGIKRLKQYMIHNL